MRKKPSQHGGHSGGHGGHSAGHGGHGGHRNNRNRKFRGGGSGGGSGGGGGNDYQSLQRQKKHAMTQKDKYNAMARDQLANGDRVNAEFYFQHVEHYTRVLAEIAEKEPPQFQRSQQQEGDDAADMTEGAEANEETAASGNASEAPEEIPLPGSLFGDAEADRVANG